MIKKISKFTLLIFSLGTFIFFYLRLTNLNIIPVFVDEAIYVRWSQVMKNEPTLRFLPQSDGKQPLFMWLTMPAQKIIQDPLIAGRSVSIISGLGTMIGLAILSFLLTRSLLVSGFAYLFYSLTPFTVFFDRMALVDSLLTMFGIWSLILGFLFVRHLRLDLAMILGFVLGGALLTKSPAMIFYLWQIIIALFFLKKSRINFTKLIGGWLVALGLSQAIFNILRLGPNFHLINARNQDYLYTYSEVFRHITIPLVYNLQNSLSWITLLLTFSTLILIVISLLSANRRYSLFILLIFIVPLVGQGLIAKVYTSRYLLYFVTPLIVSAAIGLKFIIDKCKFKPLFLIFLVMPFLLSLSYVNNPETANLSFDMRSGYLEEWTAGTGQKEVARYLINQANNGAKIVVGTEGSFGTLPDGLQIYTQNFPKITVIGVGLPIIKLSDSLLNTSKDNQIYFVVNKSRNLLDQSDIAKMKLIASYPKAERNNGTREELQFYQLIQP
jgi:4-amino-4-deoxy-L-arabinose transferase-like glycosyltransferase